MTNLQAGCRFCSTIEVDEVVDQTEFHLALASYGALVDGWLLTVPRTHVVASADLSQAEWQSLIDFTSQVALNAEAAYGVRPVMFEHGPAFAGRSAGCGVDHAHLHVVPLDVDLRSLVAALETNDAQATSWVPTNGRPLRSFEDDYLWVSDRTGEWVRHSGQASSQTLRRAIALHLGAARWDWKQDVRQDRALRTAATMRNVILPVLAG